MPDSVVVGGALAEIHATRRKWLLAWYLLTEPPGLSGPPCTLQTTDARELLRRRGGYAALAALVDAWPAWRAWLP